MKRKWEKNLNGPSYAGEEVIVQRLIIEMTLVSLQKKRLREG